MAKKTPIASKPGRAWLEAELAKAESAIQHGPDGQGWRFNETKRAAAEEHAAFLRALLAMLD